MNEQIKGVMQGALISASKSRGVDLRYLSISMFIDESDKVKCKVLEQNDVIGDISWREILGIKFMAFSTMIISQVTDKVMAVCRQNGITKENVRVRVYAISNSKTAEPKLHLFNGEEPVKAMDINELI